MDMNTYKLTKKEITKRLAITAIFNTLFALVLFYLVLDKDKFSHLFIISQFIGLSICLFVTTAMHFGVSTRLENIYGDKGSLALRSNRPSGIKAIIEVPYGSS